MITVLLSALLLQVPDTARIFDSPATEALVVRTIEVTGEIPEALVDYRARVESTMQISVAADTIGAPDLPATVDEVVSDVRWHRRGFLRQEVVGHRSRVLAPLPYTLATIYETTWVIPHLYGARIYSPFGDPPALNPFSASGPRYYRYQAEDTVRIRLPDGLITLVPISVRPRVSPDVSDLPLVIGTFYVDVDRAAVARARLGFASRSRVLPVALGQIETFLELENGLWEGQYWLPFRQRRDILFESRLLGGAVAARVVNRFVDIDLNTGWQPSGETTQLVWSPGSQPGVFDSWTAPPGGQELELSGLDFADLRLARAAESAQFDRTRVQIHYDRGSHLFRYNRVEGFFAGLGTRLLPPEPTRNRWELYATGGWAFAEGTGRGEIALRQGTTAVPVLDEDIDWGFELSAYRRLVDIRAFRPTFDWDWLYTLPALIWGADPRDYYDAVGSEAALVARRRHWSIRTSLRAERHDSVSVNTDRFLFGTIEDADSLAGIDPGNLFTAETSAQYTFGPGAFGIGNSILTRLDVEAGTGDFRYQRITALASARYSLGPVTLAARADGGHVRGSPPAQKLFRFGSVEGLRGYEENEFGGSTAFLGRGRLLIGIPPRSSQPLARIGLFQIPPLRPSLVLLGESGWTRIDDDLVDRLQRLGARPTDGFRSSVGVGLSIFDDALTVERLFPLDEDRDPRWYVGLTYWY